MPITLIIARHGNTFTPDQTPTRVGGRTDLPLVESGKAQAQRLGQHLKSKDLMPDLVFTSLLSRTINTARLACDEIGCTAPHSALPFLNEIDYGPDENKPEPDVKSRLGEQALRNWDEKGDMPADWSPRPDVIIGSWQFFLQKCQTELDGKTILLVTSNGIARFALNCAKHKDDIPLKLATGAYSILEFNGNWSVKDWNIRP